MGCFRAVRRGLRFPTETFPDEEWLAMSEFVFVTGIRRISERHVYRNE